jgi:DNA polymerase-3 subunit epsilon
MREIVLDTETTGLNPAEGHRLVEIGCVEILDQIPTGSVFHAFINPERGMPIEAFQVHGLSADFLKGHPVFADVAAKFLNFIAQDRLVIHNAEFDMRFINAELARSGSASIGMDRVVDTLAVARKKHPGGANSLDALCDRYSIDRSRRLKHGALLDAGILAEIYVELLGGRQRSMQFSTPERQRKKVPLVLHEPTTKQRAPVASTLSDSERAQHLNFIEHYVERAEWLRHLPTGQVPNFSS